MIFKKRYSRGSSISSKNSSKMRKSHPNFSSKRNNLKLFVNKDEWKRSWMPTGLTDRVLLQMEKCRLNPAQWGARSPWVNVYV